MKKETRVNHPPEAPLPADNHAVVAPIYQTVKFEFDSVAETLRSFRGERPGYFYSRVSNPTMRQLELLLAQLQGREDCLVTASGVNVIAQTLVALTKQGDHILCFIETYGPSRQIIRRLLGRFGVTHTMLSIEDLPGIERALATERTRLVFFESPTNPVTKSPTSRRSPAWRALPARSLCSTTRSRDSTSTGSSKSTSTCTA